MNLGTNRYVCPTSNFFGFPYRIDCRLRFFQRDDHRLRANKLLARFQRISKMLHAQMIQAVDAYDIGIESVEDLAVIASLK